MTESTVPLSAHTWGAAPSRVLLVHGVGSNAATWWQVAGALAEAGWGCAAVDLRGHGDSPRGPHYDPASYAADIWAWRPQGGWDLVIGHSLGGLVTAVAADHDGGSLARRLLLVDPVFVLSPEEEEAVLRDLLSENADPPGVEAVLAAHPRWSPADAVAKVQGMVQVGRDALELTMREASPWDHAGALARLTIPTLVLGADPAVGSMFDPRLMDGAGPLVSYRQVPGSGHIIQRDDPAAVIDGARVLLAAIEGE